MSPPRKTHPAQDIHPHDRYPDDLYLRQAADDDARLQPDPELRGGTASRTQAWVMILGAIIVVGLVLYGLSQPPRENQTASSPPATETTGAASPAPEQPSPQQAKPGPSDSTR